MSTGLWFVNGKVTTAEAREIVWKRYERKWERINEHKTEVETKHRKEMTKIEKQFERLKQPYTPWVGRADEGAVPEFVRSARAEWTRRKALGLTE